MIPPFFCQTTKSCKVTPSGPLLAEVEGLELDLLFYIILPKLLYLTTVLNQNQVSCGHWNITAYLNILFSRQQNVL